MPVYELPLGIALILLLGLFGGKIAQRLKMPMVVGYVTMGILLSPSLLNILSASLNENLEILKILGLGMISLTIGSELEIRKLKQIVGSIICISVVQIIGTSLIVFLAALYLLNLPLPVSLLLGAIATASAPASPLAVSREYKANGPFTKTLLGVVALLDAMCLVFFALVSAIVGMLLNGQAFRISLLFRPAAEIGGSILLGVSTGLALLWLLKSTGRKPQALALVLGFILLNSGLANMLHSSPLLTNMVTGITLANVGTDSRVFHIFDDIETPVYIAFFLLAGASLQLNVLAQNGLAATVYIVARGIGKVGGTFLGARLAGSDTKVRKYLGFGMFSKAGLTIGLVMIVQNTFPEISAQVTAIELAAVAVCSVVGPLGEKFAFISSGETQARPKPGGSVALHS